MLDNEQKEGASVAQSIKLAVTRRARAHAKPHSLCVDMASAPNHRWLPTSDTRRVHHVGQYADMLRDNADAAAAYDDNALVDHGSNDGGHDASRKRKLSKTTTTSTTS